jgi:hypothetical protein
MRDEDFNRLLGTQSNSKHFAIIFLICILMCCLLVWSIAARAEEDCGVTCTGTAWALELNGDVIARGMTETECEEMAVEIEDQTPPFRSLICREYEIAEQET